MSREDFLITSQQLHSRLDDPNLVIIDCPWDGSNYGRAHIPNAIALGRHPYIKAENDGKPGVLIEGENDFSGFAAALGLGPNKTVVAYDEWGSIFAARLWWALRYYGHSKVVLLDGGWQGWVSEGFSVSAVDHQPKPGIFTASADPKRRIEYQEFLENHASLSVWDIRSDDEFLGKAPHGNKKTGHVPGAKHLEWNTVLKNSINSQAVRTFRDEAEIRKSLEFIGLKEGGAVPYCQAAVRGAFGAFTYELAGLGVARLYDGSMAEWANKDDSPLETPGDVPA